MYEPGCRSFELLITAFVIQLVPASEVKSLAERSIVGAMGWLSPWRTRM